MQIETLKLKIIEFKIQNFDFRTNFENLQKKKNDILKIKKNIDIKIIREIFGSSELIFWKGYIYVYI